MKTIDQLVAHFEARIIQVDEEIERILHLPEGKHTTHEEHDKWITGWRDERQIARDTVSYLKTLQGLQRRTE